MRTLTAREIKYIRSKAESGQMFLSEIANHLQIEVRSFTYFCRKNGIKSNKKTGGWNCKHSHLTAKVMRYFVTHTWEETLKYSGLTESNLKSLFTSGYRDPKYAHLRKDKRTKEPFDLKTMINMIKLLGLISRKDIAIRLKRGKTHHVVRDRLKKINAEETRYVNGISQKWAAQLFGIEDGGIKTKACPKSFETIIIPWVDLEHRISKMDVDETLARCVKSMAKFQRWIYKSKSKTKITNQILAAIHDTTSDAAKKQRNVQHKKHR